MLINICRYKKETPLQETYTGGQQKIINNSLPIIYQTTKPPLSLVYRYIKPMLRDAKIGVRERDQDKVTCLQTRSGFSLSLHEPRTQNN